MKIRLNKRSIDEALYLGPKGCACYYWDTNILGFGLRVYPSGRKSFLITYSAQGRQRFYTLGRYGEMTVHQARADALELLGRARKGEDPSGERLAAHRAPTVADLADRHINDHAKLNNKPRSVKRARRLWDRCVIPRLGRRKVKDISRADIARLKTAMAQTPALANKALTLLSKALNLAEIWGWRTEGTNPCRHIQRFKEVGRKRTLSESELRRLGQVLIEAEQCWGTSPYAIATIRLLLLTGCRSAEILQLRWNQVDFEQRYLHLKDTKTDDRDVTLNPNAIQILESLKPVDGNPYVMPGEKPGSHYTSLQKTWDRIRKAAKIEDVRIHDLRHHFASTGVKCGHSLPVIGKILGHTKITTTQRYAHLTDDPVRKANDEIGAMIGGILDGKSKTDGPATTNPMMG